MSTDMRMSSPYVELRPIRSAQMDPNANGDWPASLPAIAKGASRATTLLIFNDTFAGNTIGVTWEVHGDSATGTMGASGTLAVAKRKRGAGATAYGTMVSPECNVP
jgi:hypothetical protein